MLTYKRQVSELRLLHLFRHSVYGCQAKSFFHCWNAQRGTQQQAAFGDAGIYAVSLREGKRKLLWGVGAHNMFVITQAPQHLLSQHTVGMITQVSPLPPLHFQC